MSSRRPEDKRLGYAFLPAAGRHFLTPCYDVLCTLLGVGRGFKTRVVEAAAIADGDRVLDLACGTGLAALLVKQRYPRCAVAGVDIDPRILEVARRRMAKAGVTGIDLVCAPAERTGLEGGSFDVVMSTLAFHHLPPRSKEDAAREIARVLRVGGSFFLVDLRPLTKAPPVVRDEDAMSPRWAYRANTAERLRQALSAVGLQVHEQAPPRTWPLGPWMFALKAMRVP